MHPRPPRINPRTRRWLEIITVVLVLLGLAIFGYTTYALWPSP